MDGMITVSEICKLMHISKPTLYKRIKEVPNFPQPIKFCERGRLYFMLEHVYQFLGVAK